MAIHRVGRPVASEEGFTEVAREAGLAQIEAAGAGTTAVIGEGMGDFVGEVLVKARVTGVGQRSEMVEAGVPALAVVGVIAGEEVEGRGDGDVADIAGHHGVVLELGTVRADTHDAAAIERHALLVAEADGTIIIANDTGTKVADGDVEPAVDTHAGSISGMVGTARVLDAATESVNEQLALRIIVGLTVAVLILELGEEGWVDEIEDPADEVAAARALDLGVFDHLVGHTGTLGVAGDQDTTHARGMAEGAVLVRGHVDVAVGGGRHGRRIDFGVLGVAEELADNETFRHGLSGGGEEEEHKG